MHQEHPLHSASISSTIGHTLLICSSDHAVLMSLLFSKMRSLPTFLPFLPSHLKVSVWIRTNMNCEIVFSSPTYVLIKSRTDCNCTDPTHYWMSQIANSLTLVHSACFKRWYLSEKQSSVQPQSQWNIVTYQPSVFIWFISSSCMHVSFWAMRYFW